MSPNTLPKAPLLSPILPSIKTLPYYRLIITYIH